MSRAGRNGGSNGHATGYGTRRGPERAVIAALRLPRQRRWEVEESLEELAGLAVAAGATVELRVIQEREAPTPGLYFGRGKVEEIGAGGARAWAPISSSPTTRSHRSRSATSPRRSASR